MIPAQDAQNTVQPYHASRFFYRALEPIHVGAGGYRLGRVDMTIVREPGTDIPKIPGTSLAGAARSYAALLYGKPEAAGAHVGILGNKAECPIIRTFGTAADSGGGQAGTVSLGDAQIVLFPVRSLDGCVLVTCPRVLKDSGVDTDAQVPPDSVLYTGRRDDSPGLNLGWLWFEKSKVELWTAPKKLANRGRVALVEDSLFAHIVNSNLEVRTSVVIDPETGAAKGKLLFCYEAIPRDTWFYHDVIVDDYRKYEKDGWKPITHLFDRELSTPTAEKQLTGDAAKLDPEWTGPLDVVTAGLALMKYLGVGGMGTRGFGRLEMEAL